MQISEKQIALIKIWDAMLKGARGYVEQNGFIAIHGQPLLGTIVLACENVSTLFPIDFYGTKKFMTQSNQLEIEKYSQELDKIYCEITSFRQELNADKRRLASFNLFEIEHKGTLDEILDNIEGILYSIIKEVTDRCSDELKLFGRDPQDLLNYKVARISYTDAIKLLNENGFPDLEWGTDIDAVHENRLAELLGPVLVHRYPWPIKFWNMKNDPENPKVVLSADLILPKAGESAGIAQRETDYDKLCNKLDSWDALKVLLAQGVKKSDFDWYLRYHAENRVEQHSGAGLGLNRICQFLINSDDIREATPFVINRESFCD